MFGVDVPVFFEEERLITELHDVLVEETEDISLAEVRELAMNMPAVGRRLVTLHRRDDELNDD